MHVEDEAAVSLSNSSMRPGWAARVWLRAPPVVTLLVCLVQIGKHQPWRDENATWWSAQLSFDDLWRLLSNVDAVLAPYYLFMHFWIRMFGDSPWALRLPSALAMGLACAALVALGRRLFNEESGVVAGLLFALLPIVSAFGQEARPYAFALAASTFSTLTLLSALERRSKASWAAYGGTVALIGLCHLLSLSILAAHGAAVWLGTSKEGKRYGKELFRSWVAAACAALAVVSPILLLGFSQRNQVKWIEERDVLKSLYEFPGALFGSGVVAGIVLGFALLSLPRLKEQRALLLSWVLIPPLLLFVSHPVLHLFYYRYMLFTLPAWLLLASAALVETTQARAGASLRYLVPAIALVMIAALGIVPQAQLRQTTRSADYDYRAAVKEVSSGAKAGDALTFAGSGSSHLRLAFYHDFRKKPAKMPTDIFVFQPPQEAGKLVAVECPDPVACLSPQTKRLWLVTTESARALFHKMPPSRAALLQERFKVAKVKSLKRISVALLQLKPEPDAAAIPPPASASIGH